MELAIISDTHIPSRAQKIPDPFENRIRDAEHVIHAGDFDSEGAYANIEAMSSHLTAVSGNMDPNIGLPQVATLLIEDVEFVILHGTGSPRGYEKRVAKTVEQEADTSDPVGIAGHTHELLDTEYEGTRLLNPGSVTGARPADTATMMTATVDSGTLNITAHER